MATETYDDAALRQGKTFVWHELYTPDTEASKKFYQEALDMGSTEMPMGGAGSYTMLTRDGQAVCGMMATNTPEMQSMQVPPHWAVYLSVDDVDARLKKAQECGATLVVPPIEVPTVGRFALIADPQGAHIWLFKSNPA